MRSRSRGADRPKVCSKPCSKPCPPREKRAQGRPGARRTRGPVCNSHKKCRTRAYRFGGGIRPSLRSGFTAYNALSLATGLLATIISEKHLASRELDTSTGVSEPHDFTVRLSARSSAAPCVHRIPPHVRDDRARPSHRVRRAKFYR